jgi:uncharacterized protein with HEPN domain
VYIYGGNPNLNKHRGTKMDDTEKTKERQKKNISVVKHMIGLVDRIKNIVERKTRVQFVTDQNIIELCAFQLLQMGEQTNKLRDEFKDEHK